MEARVTFLKSILQFHEMASHPFLGYNEAELLECQARRDIAVHAKSSFYTCIPHTDMQGILRLMFGFVGNKNAP